MVASRLIKSTRSRGRLRSDELLRWSVPALLIGTLFARTVPFVAAAVSLIGGFVLLAVDFSGFVPIGSYLPDSIFFGGAATELGISVIVAVVAAMVANFIVRLQR